MNFEKNYQQCLEKLIWATERLNIAVPQPQLDKMTKLLVQTMTGPWRYFHSTEHIFAVGGSTDAIEVIAALFHDIVYVQVDGSVNFNLTYYLAPYIEEDRGQLFVRAPEELPDDPIFMMAATVFNVAPGQVLSPLCGQNEFLSAVVALKVLEPFFPTALLVEIAACIEATIPFRPKTEAGLGPSRLLFQRLHATNEQFNLQLPESEIVQTVKRAVRVANRDVIGFANPSSAVFLSNTWSLLPETNHSLQKSGSYTVRDYRIALEKMTGFMNFLTPELIFRQFRGEPDDETYHNLVGRARKNLETGRLYLESKLITIAILEALSLRLGSDVSLSIMMGELPHAEFSVGSLGDSLPNLVNPHQPKTPIERDVWNLLEEGRSENVTYDLRTSPLTLFVVKYISFDGIRQMLQPVHSFFKGDTSSEELLASCDPNLTLTIAKEINKILTSRQAALLRPWKQLATDFANNSTSE